MRNILTGAVLVILGIGFSIWGHGVMMTTMASLKWPITQGNITFSEIKATSKIGPGYYYSPDVRYRYTVNGKDYNGNKVIAADYSSSSASRAGKITRQFKKGSNVNVYYNPENTSEAVLMPGGTLLTYVPFCFGIIATASGIIALLYYGKKKLSE
jgi:hypothetical protein